MQVPRMRFTVRQMMVAVAVAAVAMVVIVKPLWDRAQWRRMAQHHRGMAILCENRVRSLGKVGSGT